MSNINLYINGWMERGKINHKWSGQNKARCLRTHRREPRIGKIEIKKIKRSFFFIKYCISFHKNFF